MVNVVMVMQVCEENQPTNAFTLAISTGVFPAYLAKSVSCQPENARANPPEAAD